MSKVTQETEAAHLRKFLRDRESTRFRAQLTTNERFIRNRKQVSDRQKQSHGGRPRLHEKCRSKKLFLRLTPGEMDGLRALAQKAGTAFSDFLRGRLLVS